MEDINQEQSTLSPYTPSGVSNAKALKNPANQPEIEREIDSLCRTQSLLDALGEKLIERLAGVMNPNEKPENDIEKEPMDPPIVTPYGTRLRDLNENLKMVQRKLSFILGRLEV